MAEAIEIDPSDPGRLVEPPVIDFLAHDPELQAYVAEFVPDPKVSKERKESVYLRDGSPAARRAGELLEDLGAALGAGGTVVKVAHAGGGDFDFYTARGQAISLQDSPSPEFSFDVYAVLQVLSQEVQLEFIAQRRTAKRAAG